MHEAGLWLAVFVVALGAFFYLDGRIGTFLEAGSERAPAEREPTAAPEAGADEAAEAVARKSSEDADEDRSSPGRVVLRAGSSGHFEVKAYINNRNVDLMADTGATYVVLTWDDARNLGLTNDLQFTGTARTANGTSRVAPVMLDKVEVGDIMLHDVKAIVAEDGVLDTSLLGMSFIGRLQSFQMSGKKLVLVN
jgi:aspartyl protease family protein